MQIKNLTKNDNNVNLIIIADNIIKSIASNGNFYLTIILKDKTGTIQARLWDASENDINNWIKGNFYKVNISIIEYRNILQAKINNYSFIEKKLINFNDFIESAPINSDFIYNKILEIISNLKNNIYKKIMFLILKKYGSDFKIWPAAIRNHHEIKSGLIWHTYTMLEMAIFMSKIYNDRLINFDLLYCGIILHDMGKIIEIISDISSDFSLEGKLIGHISIMVNELHKISIDNDINCNEIIYLKHLIIASHGKLEYGSPIEPRLLEAEILSFLDNLDARIYRIDKELKKININEQTQKILSIDNRFFIKHFDKK